MSDRQVDSVADDRSATRATLLPEEKAVDSDDARAQAREILQDSEERTAGCGSEDIERRSSDDVTHDD